MSDVQPAEAPAEPCPTCGWPKYRPVAHADWCWTADPTQPVAGADLAIASADETERRITQVVVDRHPDACGSCGCIRRHAWWCPLTSSSPGRVGGNGGGAALGEVSRALAIIDRRSA